MSTGKEQEAFGLVVKRHREGESENDIRTAFQRFAETCGIATLAEMTTEVPPGVGNAGRMDLYVYNTCIEFKRNILQRGTIGSEHISRIDGYLKELVKAGTGVQNGILTDGVNYLIRRPGDDELPLQKTEKHTVFDKPEQAHLVREYLYRVLSAPAENITPTAEHLQRHFGTDSDVFRVSNTLLKETYEARRDAPTVSVKRRLWQDLLQVALGKDAAAADDESDWLFIRHTYITSLIAVIMQQQLLGDVTRHASERPDALLKGRILAEQSDLHGIIDADLFTWPTEVGESTYLREVARVVERFDWTQSPREVAPTLYQNVITQEERKKLGEYYTPRWLAQEITKTVVDDPLKQRVLDPSCGSGTFIETAVEHLLEHASELSAVDTLRLLQENVVGVDIHPVAVQLAKATWVMAAADTIRAARSEGSGSSAVSAPIYLGDSMQLRYDTGTLSASQFIELETGEILPNDTGKVTFSIPKELARQQANIDRIISEMATAIDEGRDAERLSDGYEMSDDCRVSMKAVAALMRELHAADRNHVWAYYIRNMIRPAVIAEEKVDRIIGNPPWLTYGQSSDIIRQELREMSEQRYQIWAGGKLAPHQDIATLFYTRCAELYAKPQAIIGMVMPHSALRTGQHLKWRSGNYKRKGGRNAPSIGLNLRVHDPWDLDNVVPDFFPMPSSVVFARYVGVEQGVALAPGTVQVWRGNWQADYVGIKRNNEALHHDDGKFKSPYAALSSQGPTIYDRRLFFVETLPHTVAIPVGNSTNVQARQGSQDNVKYDRQLHMLDGVVHNDHLFDVYLGECVAPYVALEPLKAALPVHRPTMTIPLLPNGDLDVAKLHDSMRRRWNNAAAMFHDSHAGRSITKLLDNLNHLNKMTDQLQYLRTSANDGDAVRVAYSTSGEPTAAIIESTSAIVESTSYQTICHSKNEAYYLIAIINSNELAKRAKPFCPTNWAKEIRHFHKHGWKLPIPRYEARNQLHLHLAKLGKAAEQECTDRIANSDIRTKPAGDAQSRPARRLLRHEWQPTSKVAQDIEKAISELLGNPAQALMAEQQMAEK